MTDLIRQFEADCTAAGISPTDAFRAGALNPSTWFRWKSNACSPTLRSLAAAQAGLAKLKREGHGEAPVSEDATLADAAPLGAENRRENITRTEAAS